MRWEARCSCGWVRQVDLKRNAHHWATTHVRAHKHKPGYHAVMVQKVVEGKVQT